MSFQGTTLHGPGRALEAHPVLISDDWRRSELRDKDGAHAVEETIVGPAQAYESTGDGAAGSGGEGFATIGPATGPGTRLGSVGSLVPRGS